MSEKLLNADEAAERLSMSRSKFYRYREKLIARGMQVRQIGQQTRYRAASIDRLIAADDEAIAVVV